MKDQRGQALVEMALVIPILLLLMIGFMQFGLIFAGSVSVTNAARAGARFAAVSALDSAVAPACPSNLLDIVNANSFGVDKNQLTVHYKYQTGSSWSDPGTRTRNQWVWVQVIYPVPIVTPFLSTFTGNTRLVTADVKMQVE